MPCRVTNQELRNRQSAATFFSSLAGSLFAAKPLKFSSCIQEGRQGHSLAVAFEGARKKGERKALPPYFTSFAR
jgi:hypothetical protein